MQKFTSALLSGSEFPLHTTELVLRKLGKKAVFVLLPHRQMGPIQHFNAVALKPQHLGHVDDHAAVALQKFRLGLKLFLHLCKICRGPALARHP